MKTKKVIKAARRLQKYCKSREKNCTDCIFNPIDNKTKCNLLCVPLKYDIKGIKDNAIEVEKFIQGLTTKSAN